MRCPWNFRHILHLIYHIDNYRRIKKSFLLEFLHTLKINLIRSGNKNYSIEESDRVKSQKLFLLTFLQRMSLTKWCSSINTFSIKGLLSTNMCLPSKVSFHYMLFSVEDHISNWNLILNQSNQLDFVRTELGKNVYNTGGTVWVTWVYLLLHYRDLRMSNS